MPHETAKFARFLARSASAVRCRANFIDNSTSSCSTAFDLLLPTITDSGRVAASESRSYPPAETQNAWTRAFARATCSRFAYPLAEYERRRKTSVALQLFLSTEMIDVPTVFAEDWHALDETEAALRVSGNSIDLRVDALCRAHAVPS